MLTTLAIVIFMGVLGVITMAILIAPFVGWFRHPKSNSEDSDNDKKHKRKVEG